MMIFLAASNVARIQNESYGIRNAECMERSAPVTSHQSTPPSVSDFHGSLALEYLGTCNSCGMLKRICVLSALVACAILVSVYLNRFLVEFKGKKLSFSFAHPATLASSINHSSNRIISPYFTHGFDDSSLFDSHNNFVRGNHTYNATKSKMYNFLIAQREQSIFPTIYSLPSALGNATDASGASVKVVSVLAVIVIGGSLDRMKHLRRQLLSYLDICEQGYDIHVVIATDWDLSQFQNELLFSSSFYCQTFMRNLPIVAIHLDPLYFMTINTNVYRYLFYIFQYSYDYFIDGEDDTPLTHSHLRYFIEWDRFLSTTDRSLYIPTFLIYETSMASTIDEATPSYNHHPLALFSTNPSNGFIIIKLNQTYFLRFDGPSPTFLFLQARHVQAVSRLRPWFEDEYRPFNEPNVLLNSRWMSRYWQRVIPLADILRSLAHHTPNRYLSAWKQGIFAHELIQSIKLLLPDDAPSRRRHRNDVASAEQDLRLQVSKCLQAKLLPHIRFTFSGSFLSSSTLNFTYFNCIQADRVPRQELEKCNSKDRAACYPAQEMLHVSPH